MLGAFVTYVQLSYCSFMMVVHHHGHQHQAISQGAPRRSRTYVRIRTHIRASVRPFALTGTYIRLQALRAFAAQFGVARALRTEKKSAEDARTRVRGHAYRRLSSPPARYVRTYVRTYVAVFAQIRTDVRTYVRTYVARFLYLRTYVNVFS